MNSEKERARLDRELKKLEGEPGSFVYEIRNMKLVEKRAVDPKLTEILKRNRAIVLARREYLDSMIRGRKKKKNSRGGRNDKERPVHEHPERGGSTRSPGNAGVEAG